MPKTLKPLPLTAIFRTYEAGANFDMACRLNGVSPETLRLRRKRDADLDGLVLSTMYQRAA
jgi:hypothetical protein